EQAHREREVQRALHRAVLVYLGDQDRAVLSALDLPLAVRLFRARVNEAIHPTSSQPIPDMPQMQDEVSGPDVEADLSLPPEAGPFEDLTHWARAAGPDGAFPFDGEPVYERL